MKYAMFLRGINVGGIKVPMADLRECLKQLGLNEVKTFLQTGNVLFESTLSVTKLKPLIEAALSQKFNYDANVLIYPADSLKVVISKCPFAPEEGVHRYVIFCADQKTVNELKAHVNEIDPAEAIAPGEGVVYWRVPKGSTLDTAFAKIISKPKFKASTTNRNTNTLEKMLKS
jgi:uncharacterized protein (DUF1697 family)